MSNVASFIPVVEIFERQTAFIRARLAGLAGALLTVATTNSISVQVFDLGGVSTTPGTAVANLSPVIADSIMDTPSTDDWPFPDGGANFLVGIPYGTGAGTVEWKGLRRYRVRVTVQHDLTSGPTNAYPDGPFVFEVEVHVKAGFGT